MNIFLQRSILVSSFLFFITAMAAAQTMDVEAVNKYWQLTEGLKQDRPLTDSAWRAFIAIEGNATYAESEFTPEYLAAYRRALEIVYMPKNDSLLQKSLKAGYWYITLAKRYKDQEAALKKYLADTVLQPDYFNRAYQYVYEYLPAAAHHPVAGLKLYYNCLSNDAVSYPNGLFFSLLSLDENKRSKAGTLEAHELHHRLRPNMDLGNEHSRAHGIAAADTGLIWALSAIPNEGIADMIDKTVSLANPDNTEGITEWLLTPAAGAIRSLDSVLSSSGSAQLPTAPPIKFFRNLLKGTVGHMPGFFMARIIVRNGYKQRMIDRSNDPFAFFLLYNKAAKKDPSHPPLFWKYSITRLKQLEKKYKTKVMVAGD